MTQANLFRLNNGFLGYNTVEAGGEWHPVFGTAVTALPTTDNTQAEEFAAHVADCGPPGCHRVYDNTPSMDLTWTTIAKGAATYDGWQDRWIWVSVKPDVTKLINGELDANINALFASIPPSKPGIKIMWTCWHEPEAKVKQASYGGPELFTATQWKQAAYKFGQLVRATNRPDFMYGPVFMSKFTLDKPDYGIQVIWDAPGGDLNDVIDFIGWDPYNEDSAQDRYDAQYQGSVGAEYYFTDITVWTQDHAPGKAIAIGETSYLPDETDLTRRVDWINGVEQFAIGQKFLVVCWFDANVSGQPPWFLRVYESTRGNIGTLTRDQPSIDAWAAVYSRHPLTFQGAGA